MYNVDQWKIMKKLASSLPKREAQKVGDIKDACFKGAPNDRVVRNAVRKPVKEGHIEIAGRGDYRLTPKGAAFVQKMEKEGFKPSAVRQMAKPARPIKKSPKKSKAVAKSAKPAAKKVAKKAAPKKTAKKAAPKKTAKAAKPSNGKVETKTETPAAAAPKKSSVKIPHPKKDEAPAETQSGDARGATLDF